MSKVQRLWWPSMTEPINCQLWLQPPRQSSSGRPCPLALSIGAHLRTEIGAVREEAPFPSYPFYHSAALLHSIISGAQLRWATLH